MHRDHGDLNDLQLQKFHFLFAVSTSNFLGWVKLSLISLGLPVPVASKPNGRHIYIEVAVLQIQGAGQKESIVGLQQSQQLNVVSFVGKGRTSVSCSVITMSF